MAVFKCATVQVTPQTQGQKHSLNLCAPREPGCPTGHQDWFHYIWMPSLFTVVLHLSEAFIAALQNQDR